MRHHLAVLLVSALSATATRGADLAPGLHKGMTVAAATRLDWTFVLSNQSRAVPPADWLPDYDSTKQRYDLFVPANYDPKRTHPLILFISSSAEPMGWSQFEPLCKQHGVIFASADAAGNGVDSRQRVRIVLDVLDDVRRRLRTDADRTYLAGFSGGARIACGIAFALPEYFGGVLSVGAAEDLREEPWLRHRVIDRLSAALVAGETDFNRGELERLVQPVLRDVGVRTRLWVVPRLGHALPGAPQLHEVFAWLEEGLKPRRELARRYPASRVGGHEAPTREEWSQALLAEAKQRLREPGGLYRGLMQLQGCMVRWNELPAAAAAKKLLTEYDGRKDRSWEREDIAEQRRSLVAHARALADYATGPLPKQYAQQKGEMAKQALTMWELIQKDGPDTPAGQEARRRIPELRRLIEGEGK